MRHLRTLAILLLFSLPALVLLGVFLHYYAGFVGDDAFISFRYAHHLASGRGLEWNPGYRVEGYSNFLWVVLLAMLRVAGLPETLGALILTWAAAALTVILIVALVAREQQPPARVLLFFAPLPLVLCFAYQEWVAMRLETALFAMLLLLGAFLFIREEERVTGPRWPSALAYLALALTRPEGIAFSVVPGLFLLAGIRSRLQLRRLVAERWLWGLVLIGGYLLYVLWRLWYFGQFFPNTYYAKVGGEEVLTKGWSYFIRFMDQPFLYLMLITILFLGGIRSRAVSLLLGQFVTLSLVVILEGGDWMRDYRLLVPAIPLLTAALAIAVQGRWISCIWHERTMILLALVLFLVFVQRTSGTPAGQWQDAWTGKRASQLINLEGKLTWASEHAGLWLKARAQKKDLIAVNHSGALPYYCDLPTIDMVGLNDLHIARVPGGRHSKWDPEYVLKRKPTYIVLNTRTKPVNHQLVTNYWGGETALVRHPLFYKHYQAVPQFWSWRHMPVTARELPAPYQKSYIGEAYIMIFVRKER